MSANWEIDEQVIRATAGNWSISLDPTQPDNGVNVSSGELQQWQLFKVLPAGNHSVNPTEIYLRENDVIARYDQTDNDTFSFQLNYRLLPAGNSDAGAGAQPSQICLELWLSVQTNLLDATPELDVQCSTLEDARWQAIPTSEFESETGLPPTGDLSANSPIGTALTVCAGQACGVWLIDPTDQAHAVLESSPADRHQCIKMFGHFMEKGVIRRARMRFHLLQNEPGSTRVRELMQQFADSPLPLTA